MTWIIVITLSFMFFAAVFREEQNAPRTRLFGSIFVIVALLVLLMAYESHEVIVSNWPLFATLPDSAAGPS
jgi:multisubunit Na+/H+ antiporter MnhB subunit